MVSLLTVMTSSLEVTRLRGPLYQGVISSRMSRIINGTHIYFFQNDSGLELQVATVQNKKTVCI